jgi:hypothetical protein
VVRADASINRDIYSMFIRFESAFDPGKWQILPMRAEGSDTFIAKISRRYVIGRLFRYTFVAQDRSERTIAELGSESMAFTIQLEGNDLGADFLASGSSLDGSSGGGGGSMGGKSLSVGLSIGGGAGVITDKATPENQVGVEIQPGLAIAPFHTLFELNGWLADRFALGAYARIQLVEFAYLFGGRAQFVVAPGSGTDFSLRLGGGYGRVSHLVDLGPVMDRSLQGPFHWTAGALVTSNLSRRWAFVAGLDFVHLIGDSPSYHFDLNLGLALSF